MSNFDWTVRRGSGVRRFSDGLVVQGGSAGLLRLWVCRGLSAGAPGAFGLLGPLAAACTSEGIRRDTGIISWLHWPDLVTIDGRVVARTSLSLEQPSRPGAKAHAVFEVSVNCFADGAPFPMGLPRTSIAQVLGVEIDVVLLREKVLHALDWYLAEWERGMLWKLVERIQPTISWLGQDVEVKTSDGAPLKGTALRMEEDGSLVLQGRATHTIAPELVEVVRLAH
jgi:biotin-(acetyl-CoA carboxylase) ligase